MNEAVIVSTARTPIGKAYRGAFNATRSGADGGHAIRHAVARAGLEPEEVDDVVMGLPCSRAASRPTSPAQCAMPAGWPVTVPGSRSIGNAPRA